MATDNDDEVLLPPNGGAGRFARSGLAPAPAGKELEAALEHLESELRQRHPQAHDLFSAMQQYEAARARLVRFADRTREDTDAGSAWQRTVRTLAQFYPGLNAYSAALSGGLNTVGDWAHGAGRLTVRASEDNTGARSAGEFVRDRIGRPIIELAKDIRPDQEAYDNSGLVQMAGMAGTVAPYVGVASLGVAVGSPGRHRRHSGLCISLAEPPPISTGGSVANS